MSARSTALNEWRDLLANGQKLICGICKFPITDSLDSPLGQLTADHIMPIKLGGGSARNNLQPAHQKCNSFKGDKMPDAYVITPRHQKYLDEAFGSIGVVAIKQQSKVIRAEVDAEKASDFPDMRLRLLIRQSWLDATEGTSGISLDEALAILQDEVSFLEHRISSVRVAA